ncbi:MAG: hypothetical protein CL526_01040 [Aequorivita sp.]|nr:hypothetical protein [Aequorivita sp.]|tara:strand:+ start:71683 stop:73098 length:1416 start_codon:yes stop_codon:yes gene_type:complete
MKHLKQYNLRTAILMLLLATVGYSQSGVKESFNVQDNVEVSVSTSYTHVVFKPWNRNKVEVEAYIDGEKLSEEEKTKHFTDWNLNITGNSKSVVVSSNVKSQDFDLAALPSMDFIGPMMDNMIGPMIKNINVPSLPADLFENIGNIQFDFEEFKKDEEGYMKKFEAKIEKKFGKDFEKRMEEWGNNFGEAWNEQYADSVAQIYEHKMEAWGENFGKQMEAWGEAYGKKMEAWAQQFEKEMENADGEYTKKVTKTPHGTSIYISKTGATKPMSKIKRTIVIKLPKDAKTNIKMRYGNLEMEDALNLHASLNYTPFTAQSLQGAKTQIQAAYAPVKIEVWEAGVLNLNFVENCEIDTVESLNLQANSSDVNIGNITNQAFLSGSFGDLRIANIADSFETLDIRLENTDAQLQIPSGAFSFYFTGDRSTLKYPKSLKLKESKSANKVVAKGFKQNNNSTKTITINSNYSNVTLQ